MNSRIYNLTCKVSEGVYKKYLEAKLGIRVCTGVLKDKEIEDMTEDLDLLNYLQKNKNCNCNEEKLIEILS